jgi:hypothetical protein
VSTSPARQPAEASPGVRGLLWAFVAFALGQAVLDSNGNLSPGAIGWLSAALVAALASLLVVHWPRSLEARAGAAFRPALTLMIGAELFEWATHLPGIYLRLTGPQPLFTYLGAVAALGVLAGGCVAERPPLGRLQLAAALLAFLVVGAWVIRTSPEPFIDVYVFQRDAARALVSGENPYALRYPDIYGNSPFYGEGLSVNGRLAFGFPYPPLSLYLVLPFQVLLGDYRYAQLGAMALAALLMALMRPGGAGRAVAMLYLLMPRSLFVLEQGWTEPLVVLAMAATVFLALHRPRWLAPALGALLVLKQYLVVVAPLALLLPQARPAPVERRRFLAWLLLPGLLSLPLALWSFKDFWFDVVALQLYQPFRTEALSYLAWWAQNHERPSTALAFLAALAGLGLAAWRAPRTPAGFAAAAGTVLLLFFAFNKQAFCNYYALVVGVFACAAALAGPDGDADTRRVTSP